MFRLQDLRIGSSIRGILRNGIVTVVSDRWFGSDVLELTHKDPTGKVRNQLLYREREAGLEVVEEVCRWSFDGSGALCRLVSEAQRIHLAHLFDSILAVHASVVEPPHQIPTVYERMLRRQPLRFLLADDPGAGKTIMAGFLIRELIARGDHQCKSPRFANTRIFIKSGSSRSHQRRDSARFRSLAPRAGEAGLNREGL